jgi:hypothetical protein
MLSSPGSLHLLDLLILPRKLLMLSSIIMLSGLITMTGLAVNEPITTQRMKGVISLIVVFGVGFASGWGPLTYVVVTEVSSLRLRDHTSRLGFAINVCFKYVSVRLSPICFPFR